MRTAGLVWVALIAGCAAPVGKPATVKPTSAVTTRLAVPAPLESPPERKHLKTHRQTLKSGLQVAVVRDPRRPVVSVRLVGATGSANETNAEIGATLFAVQLLGDAYGRTKIGLRKKKTKALRRRVAELGGVYKEIVEWDVAGVGMDGLAEDVGTYLQMLAEVVQEPPHSEDMFRLRQEFAVHVFEEMEVSDEQTYRRFLSQAAFGLESPYGRSAMGTLDTLKALKMRVIEKRQKAVFNPRRATLIVVGDVDVRSVQMTIRGAFAGWSGPKTDDRAVKPIEVDEMKERPSLIIPRPGAKKMGLCAARPIPESDLDQATLRVLLAWMAGGLESQLQRNLRLETGLSYAAYAAVQRRRHGRALLVCTQVEQSNTEVATRLLRKTLEQARSTPPTEAELARAKRMTQAEGLGRYDDMGSIVTSLMNDVRMAPDDDAALASVTAAQVQAAANVVLDPKYVRLIFFGEASAARRALQAEALGAARVTQPF